MVFVQITLKKITKKTIYPKGFHHQHHHQTGHDYSFTTFARCCALSLTTARARRFNACDFQTRALEHGSRKESPQVSSKYFIVKLRVFHLKCSIINSPLVARGGFDRIESKPRSRSAIHGELKKVKYFALLGGGLPRTGGGRRRRSDTYFITPRSGSRV